MFCPEQVKEMAPVAEAHHQMPPRIMVDLKLREDKRPRPWQLPPYP